MPRIKRGVTTRQKHKRLLDQAKGYRGRRKNTIRVARQAVENDAHAIGVSSLAAGHLTLIPELISTLVAEGGDDIVIFAGGVIPRKDYQALYDHGVAAIFGPGTKIPDCAKSVLDAIESIGA